MRKFFKCIWKFLKAMLSTVRILTIIGMFIVAGVTIYFVTTAYRVTVNQYNESLIWESTAYEAPLAEIEPALVSNVVDTGMVDAAASWDALEDYVHSLDGKSIDKAKAKSLLDKAAQWQEAYGLESEAVSRLSLYLEIEDAIPKAYDTLDTENLSSLAMLLYAMELKERTQAGQQYMERIAQVASDFAAAKALMGDTILSVGTLEDGVWTIPYTYDRSDVTQLLKRAEALRKFPKLRDMANVLSDITTVLNYNKNARERFGYQKFKDMIAGLSRSDYIAVSSVYTYGQALSYGLKVDVQGDYADANSPVEGLYYKGRRLENNQHIRKGSNVVVKVTGLYKPEATPEPTPVPTEPPAMPQPSASAKPVTDDGLISSPSPTKEPQSTLGATPAATSESAVHKTEEPDEENKRKEENNEQGE